MHLPPVRSRRPLLGLVLLLLLAGGPPDALAGEAEAAAEPEAFPRLPTLEGDKVIDAGSLRGRPFLLIEFASW